MESPQCECTRAVSVCRGWRMSWNIPRRCGRSGLSYHHPPPPPHPRTDHPSSPGSQERIDRNPPLAQHCPKDSQLSWDAVESLCVFNFYIIRIFFFYRLRSVLVIGSLRVTASCVVVVDWDVLKVTKGKHLSPHLAILIIAWTNINKNISSFCAAQSVINNNSNNKPRKKGSVLSTDTHFYQLLCLNNILYRQSYGFTRWRLIRSCSQ